MFLLFLAGQVPNCVLVSITLPDGSKLLMERHPLSQGLAYEEVRGPDLSCQDRGVPKRGRVRPSVPLGLGVVQSHGVWSCHREEPANALRQADGRDRKTGSPRAPLGDLGTA